MFIGNRRCINVDNIHADKQTHRETTC